MKWLFLLMLFGANVCCAQPDTSINAIINHTKYKVVLKNDKLYVLNAAGRNAFDGRQEDLYLNGEGFSNFQFIDFNGDGYKDLLIGYTSNVPGRQDLLLYQKQTKTFRPILNFSDYPDSQRIEGTAFYYSYHRSGCADYNWDSDLFQIVNYKIIKLGNISGIGCDDQKNGIFISKVKGEKLTLIKTIRTKGYYPAKWDFIAHYWSRNYKRFTR